MECLLWVWEEILPQMEEFKHLGILFTSGGRMGWEVDRQICAMWEERGAAPPAPVCATVESQVRWLGYLVRMPPCCLPGELFRVDPSSKKTQDTLERLRVSAEHLRDPP